MKIYLISKKKFQNYQAEIITYLKELFPNYTFISVIEEKNNDLAYCQKIVKLSCEVVEDEENARLIMIDESGALGFVASAKVKGMITAQCSDEHSAHMTREHNNALGITIGANIISIPLATEIIRLFLTTAFAAGRHMVRIDMLNKLA